MPQYGCKAPDRPSLIHFRVLPADRGPVNKTRFRYSLRKFGLFCRGKTLFPNVNTTLINLLEVVKYTIPAIIVLIAAHLIIKRFLVSELQRKQLALLQDTQNVTIPLRLQAYERLTIFIERTHSRQLMTRVYQEGMTVADLRYVMVYTINTEFEHNLSQQIYVSRKVWHTVKGVKEQEIAMIHQLAQQLNAQAPAKELQVKLADFFMTADGELPGEMALNLINEEARTVLSYGAQGTVTA